MAFFYCLPFLQFARRSRPLPWTTGGTHWVRCVKILSQPHVVLLVGILVIGGCVVLTTGRMNLSLGGSPRQVSPSSPVHLSAASMSAVYAGLFGHLRPKCYAIYYRVLGMIAPLVLVGIARTSRRSLGCYRCGIDLHRLVARRRYLLVRISGSFFNIRTIDGLSCAC
jgi:hypothetical protein